MKPNVFLKGVMIVAAGVILAWCLWVSDSTLSTQVAERSCILILGIPAPPQAIIGTVRPGWTYQ